MTAKELVMRLDRIYKKQGAGISRAYVYREAVRREKSARLLFDMLLDITECLNEIRDSLQE